MNMSTAALTKECIRSGTIAALLMMPVGWLFRAAGLRIGHYGPKLAALYLDHPGPAAQFVQHLVIGWISALPLLWVLRRWRMPMSSLMAGAIYGTAYYVALNSLTLPLFFGDPLPWQLGLETVVPSLIVHIVFGMSLGWTAGRFARPASTGA
jgi:uncharacterized membrane protein YagU involved in acid resistance